MLFGMSHKNKNKVNGFSLQSAVSLGGLFETNDNLHSTLKK